MLVARDEVRLQAAVDELRHELGAEVLGCQADVTQVLRMTGAQLLSARLRLHPFGLNVHTCCDTPKQVPCAGTRGCSVSTTRCKQLCSRQRSSSAPT